jgi:hypothetical protein
VALTPAARGGTLSGVTGRLALAFLAAAALAGAAAAAGGFGGTARQITPTQGDIAFTALTGSSPAAKPTADRRRGIRSGWQATYLKGTAKAPVQAIVLIYVYAATADAARAYSRSCTACREQKVAGVRMKFQPGGTTASPTATAVATCRNVYAAIVVGGKATAKALGLDAGTIAGAIFRRAMARGMSPCSSG